MQGENLAMINSTLEPARRWSAFANRISGRLAWALLLLVILGATAPDRAAWAHGDKAHGSAAEEANHDRYVQSLERAQSRQKTQAELLPDLTELGPERQARSIRYCEGLYFITRATGQETAHWEFNVRVKTDSSENGPKKGTPVLVSAGNVGDRWFLIFSGPDEISRLIKRQC